MLSFLSLFSLSVLLSSSSSPLTRHYPTLPPFIFFSSFPSIYLPPCLSPSCSIFPFFPFSSLSLPILLSLSMLPLFSLQFPLCILIFILFPSSLCISRLIPSLPPPFLPFYLLFAILPVFFFPPPFFCPVCPSLFNFSHSLLHPCSLFHTHNLPSVLSAFFPSSLLPSSFTSSPPPLSSWCQGSASTPCSTTLRGQRFQNLLLRSDLVFLPPGCTLMSVSSSPCCSSYSWRSVAAGKCVCVCVCLLDWIVCHCFFI